MVAQMCNTLCDLIYKKYLGQQKLMYVVLNMDEKHPLLLINISLINIGSEGVYILLQW